MSATTFRWWLGMLPGQQMLSDEFAVGEFRIRLGGNLLELAYEGPGTPSRDAAETVAKKYAAILQRHLFTPFWLMTEEEAMARMAPPFVGMPTGFSATREDRERTYRAVDAARDEMVADADPALRRVYGYMRKAQERDGRFGQNPILDFYQALHPIE